MQDTKNQILLTALRLFSQRGYEAVSVSDIAGALGMTKGALYRHYESKAAIFAAILAHMEQRDTELAQADGVPLEGETTQATLREIIAFSKTMLHYWTEDSFACAFRRMLTIEQYRSGELNALYQQYLGSGPVAYVSELLTALGYTDAELLSRSICGAQLQCYAAFDSGREPERELALTEKLLDEMERNWADG